MGCQSRHILSHHLTKSQRTADRYCLRADTDSRLPNMLHARLLDESYSINSRLFLMLGTCRRSRRLHRSYIYNSPFVAFTPSLPSCTSRALLYPLQSSIPIQNVILPKSCAMLCQRSHLGRHSGRTSKFRHLCLGPFPRITLLILFPLD